MISLVIPSLNKLAYTQRCLDSLLQTVGVEFEFVIVDNGSTDDTPSYLLDFRRRAAAVGIATTVLFNDHNVGACTARNQAINLCHGAEIAFLDNDIVLRDRQWLALMLETLYADERTAVVTPKLLFPFPPFAIEHTEIGISPNGVVGYVGRGADRNDPRFIAPREIQCSASACVLVKRAVLDEVGHFDEIFNPVQFEDNDLFYRMKSHGYRLIYEPRVEMYHFENVTTDNTPKLNFKYQTIKNGMEFKRRWRHMFSVENGPSDEELRWKELPRCRIDEIGELEIRD
ncbi:MAG TPA: glycosyltransferase [Armatimonadota bacterium]|nr:glycosyltransferase [Armatimonadota bacterium]